MADDYPFKAEYAKSNRASCKACKSLISKDSLRLAIMVQSPHFDGKVPNWFHFSCFWKRGKPSASTEIGGFDGLRWDDQEKIRSKLSGGGGNASGGKGSKKGQASNDDGHENFTAEYAKSNKSKCRGCEDCIPKGEPRLAVKDYTSQRAVMYGPQNLWYHVDCFVKNRADVGFTTDMNPDKMVGFKELNKDDQKEILEKLGKGDKTKKRKVGPVDEVDSKKKKMNDDEAKQLKSQSEDLWKYRDQLQSQVSSNAMKGLLEYNNQTVVNAESKLLDRLSDSMMFGALARCPECKEGQLVFKSDGYHCTGNISEWTKCTYMTRTPKRTAFKVPPEYHDVKFLKQYKFTKRERLFPKETVEASSINHSALSNIKIFHHGTTERDKAAIKALITSMGGTLASKLDSSVSLVISTKHEVEKMNKRMRETKDLDIPVFAEGFLDACKEGKPADSLGSYKLSDWGKNLEKSLTKLSSSARPLKSASVRAAEIRAETAFLKDEGVKKLMVKGGAAVDPESELDDVAHIMQDNGKPLNAVLSMVDIRSGSNSYYKLQVLEHDCNKRYWVFRSWGRIGTTIGGNKTESGTKQQCILKFKELFLEKTGNSWDAKEYEKYPNKFYPIEIDYGQEDEELKLKAMEQEAGKTSKLHKSVQELVKMIFDIESMKSALLEFEIDMKKMPLGKISKNNITKAYKILSQCQKSAWECIVEKRYFSKYYNAILLYFLKLVDEKSSSVQLLDASNQFFTLIPHDFGMKKPPVLDNHALIKAKIEMLDNLKEIECAYNLLKSTVGEEKDPIDAHYEALKAKIEPLDKKSDEWTYIEKYTKNTHGKTHASYTLDIDEVYTVKRAGEKSRYSPFRDLPNRMLLWHGSRLTNFAGILSQGLRIAPPEAPVTGYMFGKGIYFADMVSKSANYCYANVSNPYGLLLLCEVALGNMHELGHASYITKLPKGKHSVKGCGMTEPDPKDFVMTSDGVKIPYGVGSNASPPVGRTSLLYNEYIVYDVAQLNVKYLVKCKFNYKY